MNEEPDYEETDPSWVINEGDQGVLFLVILISLVKVNSNLASNFNSNNFNIGIRKS